MLEFINKIYVEELSNFETVKCLVFRPINLEVGYSLPHTENDGALLLSFSTHRNGVMRKRKPHQVA
jgi:hypothetical protein